MSNIESDLRRLVAQGLARRRREAAQVPPCPQCRDHPGRVVVRLREGDPEADPSCPACGRPRETVVFRERVVAGRLEANAALASPPPEGWERVGRP